MPSVTFSYCSAVMGAAESAPTPSWVLLTTLSSMNMTCAMPQLSSSQLYSRDSVPPDSPCWFLL